MKMQLSMKDEGVANPAECTRMNDLISEDVNVTLTSG